MPRWMKLVAVAVLAISGSTLFMVNRWTENIDSIAVGSCRALYKQPLDDKLAELQVEVGRGLKAVADSDDAALASASGKLEPLFKQIGELSDDWEEATNLAAEDPGAFLEKCDKEKR